MSKTNYSDREAGAKTFWVIEFVSQKDNSTMTSHPPSIHFIPTSNENSYRSRIGVSVDELEEDSQVQQEMKDLSDSIKGSCDKSLDNQKSLQDYSKDITQQIKVLGEIVDKFNNIINEFNKKEDDEV